MSSGSSSIGIGQSATPRQSLPPPSVEHDTRPDYSVLSNEFLLFQIMLEVILRLPQTSCGYDEIFTHYFEHHQHNDALVHEAQRIYIENGPIPLFTRDSFFYAKLNDALRRHDYGTLINFRHLIRSLHDDLHRHQQMIERELTVYRGQVISSRELDSLSTGDPSFIYWPNFASTSRCREVALCFAKSAEIPSGYFRVLFHITIYPFANVPTSKPFAYIGHLTAFKQEEEVLLMAGTVFRLCNTKPQWSDLDQLWIVHLELQENYSQTFELYDLLEYHKRNLPPVTGYLSAAHVLRDMGRMNDAHNCLENLLSRLPDDDLFSRAQVLLKCGSNQQALDLLTQMRQLQAICNPHANEHIGRTCKLIGDAYVALNDYPNALRAYRSALQALNRLEPRSKYQSLIASTYLAIGRVQRLMYHLEDAESTLYSALTGNDRLHLSDCYEELGRLGTIRGEYAHALDLQQRALALRESNLPQHHPDISKSYQNVADIQVLLPGEDQNALNNYRKARESLRKTFPLDHDRTREVDNKIRSISNHI